MSDADLQAIIGGDATQLRNALGDATKAMQDFADGTGRTLKSMEGQYGSTFASIADTLASFKTAIMTTLGGGAIVGAIAYIEGETTKALAEFKKIGDEADRMAVSTDFFQNLALQAKASGVEFDKVREALNKFGEQLGKLKKGYGDLKESLEAHNQSLYEQLKGSATVEEGINRVADAIHKARDPIDQERIAVQAFGKEFGQVAKVLNEGSAGLEAAAQKAREFGVVVDEGVIRHAQQLKTDVYSVATVIDLQFKQALLDIMPLMADVSSVALKVAGAIRNIRDAIVSVESESGAGLEADLQKRKAEMDQAVADFQKLAAQYDDVASGKSLPGFHVVREGLWQRLATPQDFDLFDRLRFMGEEGAKAYKKAQDAVDAYYKVLDEKKRREAQVDTGGAKASQNLFDDTKEEDHTRKLIEGQRGLLEIQRQVWEQQHKVVEATAAEYARWVEKLKLDLHEGKISQEQYAWATEQVHTLMVHKIQERQDELAVHMKESMAGVKSEFEKILEAWQSGHALTLRQIELDFVQMIERMVLKAAVLEPLFGTGKAGDNAYGIVGRGLQDGGDWLGTQLKGIFGGIFHEGGVVGEGGPGRFVDAGVFHGAVRFHQGGIAGLMPGEVPIIAREGEVIDPGDGSVAAQHFGGGAQKGGAAGNSFAIHIDARGAEIGVETKIQQALARSAPAIVQQAVRAVEATRKARPGYLK